MDTKSLEKIQEIKKEKATEELLNFGIINIDKPSGPTSFGVSDYIRKNLKEFGIKKTSHFGTLDPKVTGVLPVGLGRGCKLTGFFIGEDKEYIGVMRIHKSFELEKIKNKIKENFQGRIMQTPPVKSAVARKPREKYINKYEILESSDENKTLLFRIICQGGTYVRKLVSDLGEELGTRAHMLELRRTRAGIFSEEGIVEHSSEDEEKEILQEYPSIRIYDLEKAVREWKEKGNDKLLRELIIPGEIVSMIYPNVNIRKDGEEDTRHILTGKPILEKSLDKESIEKIKNLKEGDRICVFFGLRLIEIAKVVGGNEKNNKGEKIIAKPEFVLQ